MITHENGIIQYERKVNQSPTYPFLNYQHLYTLYKILANTFRKMQYTI